MTSRLLFALFLVVAVTSARAQMVNTYNITPQEQAACQADAMALCGAGYPDEDKVIGCMKTNRDSLSPLCRKTLTAGLARRHM